MEIPKIEVIEKEVQITDEQRKIVYTYATRVSKSTIEELCPAFLRIVLNSEKGKLKNQIGQVIFHLQKTERLETLIGLQKLLDAMIIVAREEMYDILENSDKDGKDLGERIKSVL